MARMFSLNINRQGKSNLDSHNRIKSCPLHQLFPHCLPHSHNLHPSHRATMFARTVTPALPTTPARTIRVALMIDLLPRLPPLLCRPIQPFNNSSSSNSSNGSNRSRNARRSGHKCHNTSSRSTSSQTLRNTMLVSAVVMCLLVHHLGNSHNLRRRSPTPRITGVIRRLRPHPPPPLRRRQLLHLVALPRLSSHRAIVRQIVTARLTVRSGRCISPSRRTSSAPLITTPLRRPGARATRMWSARPRGRLGPLTAASTVRRLTRLRGRIV